jgi:hypothetical protein
LLIPYSNIFKMLILREIQLLILIRNVKNDLTINKNIKQSLVNLAVLIQKTKNSIHF